MVVKVERHGDVSTLIDDVDHASEIEWERWTDWDVTIKNRIVPEWDVEANLDFFQRSLESVVLDKVFPGYTENGLKANG